MVMSTTTAGGLVSGAAGNERGKSMKITLLRGKVVNGEAHKAGKTLETNDQAARHLIATKAAKPADGKAEKEAGGK